MLPREAYRFSYIARLESEVGVLHKDDLEAVMKHYPKLFEEMKEKAMRVKMRRQSLNEERDKIRGATSTMSIKSAFSKESERKPAAK